MGVFKTLSELQDKTKKKEGGGNKFFSLKGGESVRIRFRQELTEDAANFDDEVGAAAVVAIHVNPSDFKKSSVCTGDEAPYKCWACEQIEQDWRWKPKPHMIINVAAMLDDGEGNKSWQAKILDQKFSSQHIGQALLEFAENYGSVTDRDYIFKRDGEGKNTTYKLTPLDKGEPGDGVADLEFFDVNGVHTVRPYSEQAGFYLGSEDLDAASGW